MKRIALLFVLLAASVAAQVRPAHTYSIVARDPQTGEMGVAVQSHWYCVGCTIVWAEAGVGAVATQAFVDPSYGKLGLEMMRLGRSAPDTLKALVSGDSGRAIRQVAMIDTDGRTATYTGCNTILEAGQQSGSGKPGVLAFPLTPGATCGHDPAYVEGRDFSVQANTMLNDRVPAAMARAFTTAKGDLAARMMAALEAAQATGGDIRGQQSAALVVVNAKPSGKPWLDRRFDIRVDDHPEPLKELRRLLLLSRAYNHMNAGDLAIEHKDNEAALREYSAAAKLVDGVAGVEPTRLAEMLYWHAIALVTMERVDEALPLFRRAYAINAGWRDVTRRLPKSGLLPSDPKLIERIAGAK